MFFKEYNSASAFAGYEASETGLTGDEMGVQRLIAESAENWFNLREKMMKLEHVAIISEDVNLLSEGASDFFKRIADWFRKLGARIMEIFKKFSASIQRYTAGDADFVKKYKPIVEGLNLKGVKITARKWDSGELAPKVGFQAAITLAEGLLAQVKGMKSTEQVKGFREEVEGNSFALKIGKALTGEAVEANKVAETVRSKFFEGGKSEEVEMDASSFKVEELFSTISNAAENISDAQKGQKAVETLIENCAKFYDHIASEISGGAAYTNAKHSDGQGGAGKGYTSHTSGVDKSAGFTSGTKSQSVQYGEDSDSRNVMRDAASVAAGGARRVSSVASAAFGQVISAITSRRSEYKGIIAKMISRAGGRKATKEGEKQDQKDSVNNESYDFGAEYAGSILDQF